LAAHARVAPVCLGRASEALAQIGDLAQLGVGLAEAHGGLPHKRKQQEEKGDDRQDIDQGTKSLVGLRKLGQGLQGVRSHPRNH